ncbi:dual specificity protein phosphatase 23b isoform X2 [Stegostoma tigrinum]|uniref:dual specificity protein phosphatase 23b isoform X2 n=1 Tax=Stegostoma tigrinum TaxID=3053191 RepID=UPI00287057E7|nr:dual specificity protein phosphatase 23b isoform X2 [Stegostoma tigrinum]
MASAPHNFSWIEPKKLAGMAMPRLPAHYQYLYDNGIKHLITLSERKPPYHDTCPGLKIHHIKIDDFCPPSFEQIKRFLAIVEEANAKGEEIEIVGLEGDAQGSLVNSSSATMMLHKLEEQHLIFCLGSL